MKDAGALQIAFLSLNTREYTRGPGSELQRGIALCTCTSQHSFPRVSPNPSLGNQQQKFTAHCFNKRLENTEQK